MKPNKLTIAALGIALSAGLGTSARANNNLNTSYRAGSVSLPSADDNSSSSSSAVSANQGRVGYRISVVAPPGKAGLEPNLTISYSGSRREGVLGAGWVLSVPKIRVRAHGRGGQPDYGVAATYLGLNNEPLIQVGAVPDIDSDGLPETVFREERDRSYYRYIELTGGGWRVDFPDGRKLTLGTSASSQVVRSGAASSIAAWLPETRTDSVGNELIYTWVDAQAIDASALSPTARYLSAIRYGCQNCASASNYQEVRFNYANRSAVSASPAQDLSPGFLVETEHYLASIETASEGGVSGNVRRYTFGYDATGTRLLLTSVDTVGAAGTTLPRQSFAYTTAQAPGAVPSGLASAPGVLFQAGVQPMDLDKDGRIDIVDLSNALTARVYNNTDAAGAGFDAGGTSIAATPGAMPTIPQVSVEDTDRDLGMDVVDLGVGLGLGTVYAHDGAGGWSAGQAVTLPIIAAGSDTVRIDVNLDGHVDLVDTSPALEWVVYLNDGAGDYTTDTITCAAPTTPALGGALHATDAGVLFGDVNGDGVTDVVYLDGTSTARVFPGRGRGCWGYLTEDNHGANSYESVTITSGTGVPTAANTRLADVNGDGFADLVEITSPSTVNVWFFSPLTGWSDATSGGPWTQNNNTSDDCRIADFDHDGVKEVLCSSGWNLYDFASGRAHLLSSIDNGRGVVTTMGYTTTARVAAAADAAGAAWTHNVAAAISVVDKIQVDDGRDHVLVREFGYRDAYYLNDGLLDRFEFTGFGMVSEKVVPMLGTGANLGADPSDPGVLRRTFYDLGDTDWYLRGTKTCEEAWPAVAVPATQSCNTSTGAYVVTTYENRSDMTAAGYVNIFVDADNQYVYEQGASATHVRTERSFDAYGNITQEIRFGTYDAVDASFGDDERVTETDYITDLVDWNLRLPKRIRVGGLDSSGPSYAVDALSVDYYVYDGAATWNVSGVSQGLLTSKWAWTHDPTTGSDTTTLVAQRTHTAEGMVDLLTNADGVIIDHDYDAELGLFKLAEVLDPTGLNLSQYWDVDSRHGKPTRLTAADGAVTEVGYDELGRMTWIAKPGDSVASPTITRSYTDAAPLSHWTDVAKDGTGNGLTTVSWFDGNARLLCKTVESYGSKVDVKSQRDYSARGVVALNVNPYRANNCQSISVTSSQGMGSRSMSRDHDVTVVDAMKRKLSVTRPDGSARTWAYGALTITENDEEDNAVGSVHAGTSRVTQKDGANRIISISETHLSSDDDPGTHTFEYEWDALGNPSRVTDSSANVVFEATRDSRGRLVRKIDADRGQVDTVFDDMNRPVTVTDARGEVVSYTYDNAGRVATVVTSEGTSTYYYDTAFVPADTAACHTPGRLAWVDDPHGHEILCYDARGQTVRADKFIDSYGATALTTERTYDSMGRVTELIHPDGTSLQYSYGKTGGVRTITAHSGVDAHQVAVVRYQPSGQVKRVELGNGVDLVHNYDNRLRVSRLRALGGTTLQDLAYAYDKVGNITQVTDAVGQASATFEYDDLYRLTSASGDRFDGETATYRYDRLGNLTDKSFSDAASSVHIGALTYGHATKVHAVTAANGESFAYDDAGNLNQDGSYTYSYTGSGYLASVDDLAGANVMTFEYDYNNERVSKTTASGDTVYYAREADAELRTTGGVSTWVKYVRVAGKVVGRIEDTFTTATLSDHVFYVASDHLGSPTLVMDTAGSVIERAYTHPYGEENTLPLSSAGTLGDYKDPSDATTKLNLRFQGREVDAETGMYDFGARIYRADLGRFMSADTVIPDPTNGQSWNRYSFVRNNPLGFTDPSGNEEVPVNDDEFVGPVEPLGDGPGSMDSRNHRSLAEAQQAYDQGGAAYGPGPSMQPTPVSRSWRVGTKHQWIDGVDGNLTVKVFGHSFTVNQQGFQKWSTSWGPVSGSSAASGQDFGVTVLSVRGGLNNTGPYVGAGKVKLQCQGFSSNCSLQSGQGIQLGGVGMTPYQSGNTSGVDVSFKAFEVKAGKWFGFSSTATVKLRAHTQQTQHQIINATPARHVVFPLVDAMGGN